jgi:hypothetical protein
MTFDKVINGGCSRRKPDVFIDVLTHSIVVECDENQHGYYTCENKRTMDIFQDLGNKPLVMLRFNPDSYVNKNNCKIPGCFKVTEPQEEWSRRAKILKLMVGHFMRKVPKKEITICKLFYDNFPF